MFVLAGKMEPDYQCSLFQGERDRFEFGPVGDAATGERAVIADILYRQAGFSRKGIMGEAGSDVDYGFVIGGNDDRPGVKSAGGA